MLTVVTIIKSISKKYLDIKNKKQKIYHWTEISSSFHMAALAHIMVSPNGPFVLTPFPKEPRLDTTLLKMY